MAGGPSLSGPSLCIILVGQVLSQSPLLGTDDPESCVPGVQQMVETAHDITQEVHHELTASRKRFVKIIQEFVGCNILMSQASSYRSSFAAKVRSHMQFRRQQKTDRDVTMMCKVVLSAAGTNQNLLCKREGRTRVTTDLVPSGKPAVKVTWYVAGSHGRAFQHP